MCYMSQEWYDACLLKPPFLRALLNEHAGRIFAAVPKQRPPFTSLSLPSLLCHSYQTYNVACYNRPHKEQTLLTVPHVVSYATHKELGEEIPHLICHWLNFWNTY